MAGNGVTLEWCMRGRAVMLGVVTLHRMVADFQPARGNSNAGLAVPLAGKLTIQHRWWTTEHASPSKTSSESHEDIRCSRMGQRSQKSRRRESRLSKDSCNRAHVSLLRASLATPALRAHRVLLGSSCMFKTPPAHSDQAWSCDVAPSLSPPTTIPAPASSAGWLYSGLEVRASDPSYFPTNPCPSCCMVP